MAAAAAPDVFAQAAPGAAAPDYGGLMRGQMSIKEIFKAGGSCMYPLTALSILAVWFVFYFFAVLRPVQVVPPTLFRDVLEHLRGGRRIEARHLCELKPGPLSTIVLSATDYASRTEKADPAMLRDVIEGEGSRQSEEVQGQIQYLLDIAVVAPMVGLLGTVFGMMHAFGSIANDIASAKPVVIAEGVSEALITTAYGLMIGIPAMAFYAYFRRRAASLVSRLEAAGTDVLTAMSNRRRAASPVSRQEAAGTDVLTAMSNGKA
jgi:biopolymer transport protein ExbB